MPNEHKIIEIDKLNGCKHVRLHKFNTPSIGEDNFYRTSISFGSFFYSRHSRNNTKKVLFYLIDERIIVDTSHNYDDLPVTEHKGLYEFFNYIGYDRKKKRILNIR